MRRLNLSTVLVAFNLGVVAVAVVSVGIAGVTLLRQMANEQALTRVRLGTDAAVRLLADAGEELAASAQQLADLPSVTGLLRAGESDSLRTLLESFREAHGLTSCALRRGDGFLVAVGTDLPPVEGMPGRWFLQAPRGAAHVTQGAVAAGVGIPQAQAIVARLLDLSFAEGLSLRVGLPVTLLTPHEAQSRGAVPSVELRLRALEGKEGLAAHLSSAGIFASVSPLRDPQGDIGVVVEIAQPEPVANPPLSRLIASLLAVALLVGGLATVFSLLLARSVARPVEELTEAAARMGRGDFAPAVPRSSSSEIAMLADAMEGMRERIHRQATELRRRQAEAEAVLTGIVEGVFAVGRARHIRYLNPQAAALLGVQPDDAIGRFCGDVLNPQGAGGKRPCEESCPILHARFRGSASATEHLLLPGGQRRTVVITSSPAGSAAEDGVEVQFQVIRDETEQETTRRLRDAVLANISHEFRTPLSAQLASLELLRDRLPETGLEEVRDLVGSIERGTLRLTRLVDNLLESTRIEAGEDSLRRLPVALDGVIEEAVELMAPLIDQRQQSLRVELPYPLPAIVGDATRLAQVFVNLLANANKFAPAESAIRIGGDVRESEIRLWVADEGPGLPEGAGEAIFQRFTRSTGEEPEASGMGLGLFIVKSIIDRHGGRVTAESDRSGTRITVSLPREALAGPAGAPGEAPPAADRSPASGLEPESPA
jgi:signal transduction histidine kinase